MKSRETGQQKAEPGWRERRQHQHSRPLLSHRLRSCEWRIVCQLRRSVWGVEQLRNAHGRACNTDLPAERLATRKLEAGKMLLESQNKEMKATRLLWVRTPRQCCNTGQQEWEAGNLKARVTAAAAADGRPLRKRKADNIMGHILQEVKAGQAPEWKDIADRSPIYRNYWAQWNSLTVRTGVLQHQWESADRSTTTGQIVLLGSKVKEVLNAVLLATLEKRHSYVVPTVWHLHNKPRSWNQEPGPDASV
jgi:hypothetical protein